MEEVARKWFHSPCIEIEGYIGNDNFLGQIARLYFEPDTELRIRELLRYIDIGFRVRQDNDGLFMASQKRPSLSCRTRKPMSIYLRSSRIDRKSTRLNSSHT